MDDDKTTIEIGQVWKATIHKAATFPRKVEMVHSNGTVVWRQEGRLDLLPRTCGARAWAAWVKKFRAKGVQGAPQTKARGWPADWPTEWPNFYMSIECSCQTPDELTKLQEQISEAMKEIGFRVSPDGRGFIQERK